MPLTFRRLAAACVFHRLFRAVAELQRLPAWFENYNAIRRHSG